VRFIGLLDCIYAILRQLEKSFCLFYGLFNAFILENPSPPYYWVNIYKYSSCSWFCFHYLFNSSEIYFGIWYKVRICLHFLYVDIQFSQHHLLKQLFFPHWMVLAILSPIIWLCMWGLLSGLSNVFVLFVCVSIFMPVPYHLDN